MWPTYYIYNQCRVSYFKKSNLLLATNYVFNILIRLLITLSKMYRITFY